MRDLFPGFYKRSDEELSKIWKEGIFVFDTNMLLNVYRYKQKTRARYLEILDLLKQQKRLWIPYQVAYEYQDRRLNVIQGQLDAYTEIATILQSTSQKLANSLDTYQNRHEFIHTETIIKDINDVISKAKSTVTQGKTKDKKEYEALKKQDAFLEKLENLFYGNIGKAYTSEELGELYKHAQERIELRIPPGWEDEDKKGFKRYGDIILWFQLIDHARSQKKPVIFVTDDGKKDWWIRDSQGKPINPIPELIQEMFVEADVLLHMYQGYNFLDVATHFFNLKDQPEIIADAMAVTEQNIAELNQLKKGIKVSALREYYLAEDAVREWLLLTYGKDHKIIANSIESPDFIMVEPDGTRIGIEIKSKFAPYTTHDLAGLLGLVNIRYKGLPLDKFMIIVVCRSEENANKITERIQRVLDVPSNISFVIGILDTDGKFTAFSELP